MAAFQTGSCPPSKQELWCSRQAALCWSGRALPRDSVAKDQQLLRGVQSQLRGREPPFPAVRTSHSPHSPVPCSCKAISILKWSTPGHCPPHYSVSPFSTSHFRFQDDFMSFSPRRFQLMLSSKLQFVLKWKFSGPESQQVSLGCRQS